MTRHSIREPLSQIHACNSILWAVTQCNFHLGSEEEGKTGLWYWMQVLLDHLGKGNHSQILFLLWWQAQICLPRTRNQWKPVGKKNLHLAFLLVCQELICSHSPKSFMLCLARWTFWALSVLCTDKCIRCTIYKADLTHNIFLLRELRI